MHPKLPETTEIRFTHEDFEVMIEPWRDQVAFYIRKNGEVVHSQIMDKENFISLLRDAR